MTKITKRLFVILIGSFLTLASIAQEIIVPPAYILYKGDSLNGFDWKANFDAGTAKGLKGKELTVTPLRAANQQIRPWP